MKAVFSIPGVEVRETGPGTLTIIAPGFILRVRKRYERLDDGPHCLWAFDTAKQSTPLRPAHFTLRNLIHEALNGD